MFIRHHRHPDQTAARQRCHAIAVVTAMAMLFPVLCAPSTCCGDLVVTKDGTRHQEVQLQRISSGNLHFRDQEGRRYELPCSSISRIEFDNEPRLGQADAALEQGNGQEALALLLNAAVDSRDQWQRLWILARLSHVHAELGQPIPAVGHVATIINMDDDPSWLRLLPRVKQPGSTAHETAEAMHALQRALETTQHANVKARFRTLHEMMEPWIESMAASGTDDPWIEGTTISGYPLDNLPPIGLARKQDVTPATTELRGDMRIHSASEIDTQLSDGRYKQALTSCRNAALKPGQRNIARLLYQYGMALRMTDQGPEASIKFMQNVVLFPDNRWASAAIMETALIHMHDFNDPDVAGRLAQLALDNAEALGEEDIASRAAELIESIKETP